MKIEIDIDDDISLFIDALNNAIIAYGNIVHSIFLCCSVPSNLEPLKKIPYDVVEKRFYCLKNIYKQLEKIEQDKSKELEA